MTFIVICRADRTPEGQPGRYELATRTVFETEPAANSYAATLSPSREPIVVPAEWAQLRFGEPRGTDAYWRRVQRVGLRSEP